jgi:hypothetical protein
MGEGRSARIIVKAEYGKAMGWLAAGDVGFGSGGST